MNKNRDDFSKTTKDILRDRAGHRCSNPHCKRMTSGPGALPTKAINMGTAAHICAAAPKGPRYDENQTTEERISPENGIWLCNFCADLIDKDVTRYTVDLLHQWKDEAEKEAEYSLHGIRDIYTANLQYANSFVETLFLHKDKVDSKVNLKNLYVMPNYIDIYEKRDGQPYTLKDDLKDKIAEFVQSDNLEMMFISGSGGSGKTTLVSWMNYHYAANDQISKELFGEKTFITIRLRDLDKELIAKKNSLIPALRTYMQIQSLDELEARYPDSVMVLDGFDELCMVEGLTTPQELIYDLYKKRLKGFKYIITSRPKYLSYNIDIPSVYYSIQHFGLDQISEWLMRYTSEDYCNETIDEEIINYLVEMDENSISVICDTPMNLYMLVSKKADHLLVNNSWALYRHIFYNEMNETEYNQMFPDPDRNYSHDISILKDVLYQISEEIAYKMYQCGNEKFFLAEEELKDIIAELSKEHPILNRANMKEIASHCYALCCYWKESSEKGAVEFLHNDIRDFFLAEKIYRQFEHLYETYSSEKRHHLLAETSGKLFAYGVLETKVTEFLLLRSMYNKDNKVPDFAAKEYHLNQAKTVISQLFTDNRIYANVFADCNKGYPIEIIENIITCAVQVYRHVLEPYINEPDAQKERIDFFDLRLTFHDVYARSFSRIFRQVPVTLSEEHMLSLASRWNFGRIKLKGQDLRNIGFQYSKMDRADFSDCILAGCDFTGADLYRANFVNADVHYACLKGAVLEKCDFTGADLRGTELPDGFCSMDQEEQREHLRSLGIDGLRV